MAFAELLYKVEEEEGEEEEEGRGDGGPWKEPQVHLD